MDKPPLFLDLRPMTLAELAPGETWTPDMMVLEARPCDQEGNLLPPRTMRLSVPPSLRANTFENMAEIFRQFRRIAPDVQTYIDGFALFMRSAGAPDDGRPMWEPRTVPG